MTDKVFLRDRFVYAFNVSPDDHHQYVTKPPKTTSDKVDSVDRLKTFNRYWSNFFTEFKLNDIEIFLRTELSEPVHEKSANQESRLHFHGYILFKDVSALKWFLLYGTVLLSRVSRYTIVKISDADVWRVYVRKQSFLKLPKIESPMTEDEFHEQASTS